MIKSLSYSELSSFLWNKDEWKSRYIDGISEPPNDKMILGKIVHQSLEDEKYPWLMALKQQLPQQNPIPIRKILNKMSSKVAPAREVRVTATTKDGTGLLAYWDGFDKKERVLYEYKTSAELNQWQPWKVDFNRQLSMYAYMYKLKWHNFFREIRLFYLNTEKGTVETFLTARGPRDIDLVAREIKDAVAEMRSLGLWEKRLTKSQRALESQGKLNLAH